MDLRSGTSIISISLLLSKYIRAKPQKTQSDLQFNIDIRGLDSIVETTYWWHHKLIGGATNKLRKPIEKANGLIGRSRRKENGLKFDQEVLAGNIRGLRHKARMSQQEVADALGVDANTVSNYESGRTVPSFEKAWMIASLFGVSLDALGGRNAVVE